MSEKQKLKIEHFLLFILYPISLLLDYSTYIKLGLGLILVAYVIWLSIKNKYFRTQKVKFSASKKRLFFKHLLFKLLVIVIATTSIVLIFYRDDLFNSIRENPFQYIIITGVYVFFSVVPQEFIYRKFYFVRYRGIFKSKLKMIGINTFVFSLGHLFFENLLVVFITLVGGLIFSISYYKFQSFKYICLEHSLYGLWLYTIGLGGLLGFPVN